MVQITPEGIKKKPGSDINIETFAFEVQTWLDIGGEHTMQGFVKLPQDEREDLLEYLEDFSLYEMINIQGKKFILTHIGLPKGAALNHLDSFDAYDFIADPDTDTDYGKQYFEDIFFVTGHVPTFNLGEAYKGRIYREHNHIALDTGAVFTDKSGGIMGCICLETDEEYYV